MIQNQSKGDLNHPLERVLTATICQAMFNHDRSLETAWACGRVGECRQRDRLEDNVHSFHTSEHLGILAFLFCIKKCGTILYFFWKSDNSHKMWKGNKQPLWAFKDVWPGYFSNHHETSNRAFSKAGAFLENAFIYLKITTVFLLLHQNMLSCCLKCW